MCESGRGFDGKIHMLIASRAAQEEKDALDDLATELELADEDELIPCVYRLRPSCPGFIWLIDAVLILSMDSYKLQSSFLHLPAARVIELVQATLGDLDNSLSSLQDEAETAQREMGKLKAQLYAKFGSTSSHTSSLRVFQNLRAIEFHRLTAAINLER
jgi:hypothetical protein